MAVLKCKMCGANLEFNEASTVVRCEFCDSLQTLPVNLNDEKKMNLFNRANAKRIKREFDQANGIYESIVAEYPEEAEAYWGLCLCKYGIEYVDDPKTGNKIPTCHRTSTTSIFEDDDFKSACKYADHIAKEQYKKESAEIDRLQKRIIEIASKEDPYDIFICYKESDDSTRERTEDSTIAHELYSNFLEKGYRVFYSRITLRNLGGVDYEPYIYSALASAKVMIVVGTKPEYFNAVWVKNEWARYLKMLEKHSEKGCLVCYKDMDAYELPEEFSNLQALDISSVTFFENLINSVTRFLPLPNSKVDDFSNRKVVITSVTAFGSNESELKNHWDNCKQLSKINKDEFKYIYFHYYIAHYYTDEKTEVERKFSIVDSRGVSVHQKTKTLELKGNKTNDYWGAGKNISNYNEGEYKVIFEIGDSVPYEYTFTITSNSVADEEKRSNTNGAVATIDSLLERAEIFLADKDFKNANIYYDKILDVDPTNAKAYLGKLCVDLKLSDYDALRIRLISFEDHPDFKKALRFAKGDFLSYLQGIVADFKENLYKSSMRQAKNGSWDSAIENFKVLGDYKKSKEMINKCLAINNFREKLKKAEKERTGAKNSIKYCEREASNLLLSEKIIFIVSVAVLLIYLASFISFVFYDQEMGLPVFLFISIGNVIFIAFSDPLGESIGLHIDFFSNLIAYCTSNILYTIFSPFIHPFQCLSDLISAVSDRNKAKKNIKKSSDEYASKERIYNDMLKQFEKMKSEIDGIL